MQYRMGDHMTGRAQFRSDRVFSCNAQWFVQTREKQLGPFESRKDAMVELTFFLRDVGGLSRGGDNSGYLQFFAE